MCQVILKITGDRLKYLRNSLTWRIVDLVRTVWVSYPYREFVSCKRGV